MSRNEYFAVTRLSHINFIYPTPNTPDTTHDYDYTSNSNSNAKIYHSHPTAPNPRQLEECIYNYNYKDEWMNCRLCRAQLVGAALKNFFTSLHVSWGEWWNGKHGWISSVVGFFKGEERVEGEEDVEEGCGWDAKGKWGLFSGTLGR